MLCRSTAAVSAPLSPFATFVMKSMLNDVELMQSDFWSFYEK